MRVGIFVDSYKPTISGVVHSVDFMRQGLEALGCEVHIFAPAAPGYRDNDPYVYRFPSVNLSTKVGAHMALPVSRRLLGLIPRLRLDIIHTQHPFSMGRVGVFFARRLNLPAIYTFHTQYEHYAHYAPLPKGLFRALARRFVIQHAERCDLITCPAPSARSLLLAYGIRRPIEILPNAIDTERFAVVDTSGVRARLGISAGDQVLAYCGRLSKEKNLPFMLHALRDVLLRAPRARLLLIGEGTERKVLAALATRLGITDRIVFTGRVEYPDVARYYAAADLFVMTSLNEVHPLAPIEAMASGLPVVAVGGRGLTDTVTSGTNGLLTEYDAAEFAHAVRYLLSADAVRLEMGRRARETAQQYSVHEVAPKIVAIYEQARELHLAGQLPGRAAR